MSMFLCARCDELKDSDDGCEEYKRTQLICIDCMNDLEDDAETYHTSTTPFDEAARVLRMRAEMNAAMGPDYSRKGIFINHNCAYCRDGELPCKQGAPNRCDNPRARND